MPATAVAHRALNGALVRLSGEGATLTKPATSIVTFEVADHRQEFTTGVRPLGESIARGGAGVELVEEYSYKGGRLRLGQRFDPDTTVMHVGVWEGLEWSFYTLLYGGTKEALVATIDQLDVSETAEGLVLQPRDPSTIWSDEGPCVVKGVPGIGLLEVFELNDRTKARLPRWKGTEVEGGELFVDEMNGGGNFFVLAGGGSYCVAIADPNLEVSAIARRMARFTANWARA